MLFNYLVIVIALKLASVGQKSFGFFFVDKNLVLAKYQSHPLTEHTLMNMVISDP